MDALNLRRLSDRLMRHLQEKTIRLEQFDRHDDDAEHCPLLLTAPLTEKVWQAMKTAEEFKGLGGKRAFWAAMGILMMEGQVEGDVGRSPRDGDWMQLATQVTGLL